MTGRPTDYERLGSRHETLLNKLKDLYCKLSYKLVKK